MKRYFTILAILFLAIAQSPVLDDITFPKFIQEHQLVFVKFFAPWCGHCKAIAPEIEKLYALTESKKFAVANVDCTVTSDLCQQYNVNGYPTLLLLMRGNPIEYEGQRTASAMAQWIQAITLKQIITITSQQVEAKKETQSFVLASGLGKSQLFALKGISFNTDSVNFYTLESETTSIRLYLKDKEPIDYPQTKIIPSDLSTWIFHQTRPAVLPLSVEANFGYIRQQSDFRHILVLVSFSDENSLSLQAALQSYCADNRQKTLCAIILNTDATFKIIQSVFDIKEKTSGLFLVNSDFTVGYRFSTSQITPTAVASFVAEGQADKLDRFFDSNREKRQKFNYANVIKLTEQNYNETLKNNKFVFVEYYSPNCKHCVNFAPDYDKIGAHFKESEVVIAAVDVSEHEAIAVQEDIEGYPSLRFFIHGVKIPYESDRSVKKVVSFINDFVESQEIVVASKKDIVKPAVTVSGISSTSVLHFISGFFKLYPVYLIKGDKEFSLQIHNEDGVESYQGKQSLTQVIQWLQEQTSPILLDLGAGVPSPKLKKVIQSHLPILGLINKGEKSVEKPLAFLTAFCKGQTLFACGYANKGADDYESLANWIGDLDPITNRLVVISPEPLEKYVYQGDVDNLNVNEVIAWLISVQKGEVDGYKPEATTQSESSSEAQVVDSSKHNVEEL